MRNKSKKHDERLKSVSSKFSTDKMSIKQEIKDYLDRCDLDSIPWFDPWDILTYVERLENEESLRELELDSSCFLGEQLLVSLSAYVSESVYGQHPSRSNWDRVCDELAKRLGVRSANKNYAGYYADFVRRFEHGQVAISVYSPSNV